MSLQIEIETDIDLGIDIKKEADAIVDFAIDYMKCPYECEVNLTLTDNEGIHSLNKEYRDIDRPTDVLSFPMVDYEKPNDLTLAEENVEDYFNPDTGELMLGDIVISAEKVIEQANEYGHSIRREFCFLIVHSMLHLFGYDHMEDEERIIMEGLQREILDAAGITR